tara:strand:- start:386 stop:547 length:162 start_codon:yes stop_codon:yes gene_type:complete
MILLAFFYVKTLSNVNIVNSQFIGELFNKGAIICLAKVSDLMAGFSLHLQGKA